METLKILSSIDFDLASKQLLIFSVKIDVLTYSCFPTQQMMSQIDQDAPHQDLFTLRALINSKEAGIIIGQKGKNVTELRSSTGVRAGVSKVFPGIHERILTITGDLVQVSKAFGWL